jgi:hypothetical protein
MYFYVDTHDMCNEPKDGVQWTAWVSIQGKGREFTDIIKGEECKLRAMSEEALIKFIRSAYSRAPWLKAEQITEYKGDE